VSKQLVRNGYVAAWLCALLVAAPLLVACQGAPTPRPPTPTPEPPTPTPMLGFPSPGPSPEGLAWDDSHLWVVDGETLLLYQVDPATGEPVRELGIAARQPRGIAWDGENLWVVDEEVGNILRLDPETGEETRSIEAPKLAVEGPWSIADLTWDGKYLWVAIHAGWCSSSFCVDPESGEVVVSFFPQCDPRGLASDGTHLWTIAYNGDEFPSKLDQRTLSDNVAEMAQSQEFLLDLRVKDPTGLAYGDGVLWAADRAERRIFQIKIQ
jgi:streptogramin lyase